MASGMISCACVFAQNNMISTLEYKMVGAHLPMHCDGMCQQKLARSCLGIVIGMWHVCCLHELCVLEPKPSFQTILLGARRIRGHG